MKLFSMDTETYALDLEPEVLTIKEFSALFRRDKSKNKSVAMAELAYVWFISDFKSDFIQIIDEQERSAEIISSLDYLPKNWEPDDEVKAAVQKYRDLSRSVTSRMLDDARAILDNMSKYAKNASEHLDEVVETKFGERNKYDITKIQSFINSLPKLHDTINYLEEKVLREKDTGERHRGSQEKAMFEDEEE